MRSSDFLWRILGHNSCLETNKESWSSQRLGGKKGNSSISPVFWFFTNFPTVQVHTDMLCVCPCLSPPALTAWSVHGLNSKDAFWEVYIYKHTPSCQVLGLCCQTIAFMSWGFSAHCKPSDACRCFSTVGCTTLGFRVVAFPAVAQCGESTRKQ